MKTSTKKGYNLFIVILFFSCFSFSQGLGEESDRIKKDFKFIPLPYADYDISSGYTVGFIPMTMFNPSKKDTISPSSIAGLFGMYSQNKSKFFMGFGMLYLKEDNYRVLFAGGLGDFNYQAYVNSPFSRWFNYNTGVDFFYISAQKKIATNTYLGAHYEYTNYLTTIETNYSQKKQHQGLGVVGSFDKRDNIQYPRKGDFLEADIMIYPSFINQTGSSSKTTLKYNKYTAFRKNKDILASRVLVGLGFGEITFNQQFIIGETDIRGYSHGKYRGNHTIAIQSEYRWNFHKTFGLVGFAGVATIFEANNPNDNGKILPGIGTGIRYNFLKDTHSNLGIDIAKGIDDWGLYFRISEAF